jgi:putative chitinase
MTIQELAKAVGISENLAAVWWSPLTNAMERYNINTPLRQAHFLAQIGHESNGFTSVKENLNYSVEGLLKTFSRHRISEADANKYGRKVGQPANQQMIANLIYGGEWGRKNLGNTQEGDGWLFRGRGLIQITGRANYSQLNKALNFDLLNRPERIAEDNLISAMAAGWFWDSRSLNALADRDDVEGITRRINGGLNGLNNRARRLATAKSVLMT